MAQLTRILSKIYQLISGQCSHFIPPEKNQKAKGLLVITGGINWEYWAEMGIQ